MQSYSGTQMMNASARVGLLDDMESVICNKFSGYVTRPLLVTLTTGSFMRS